MAEAEDGNLPVAGPWLQDQCARSLSSPYLYFLLFLIIKNAGLLDINFPSFSDVASYVYQQDTHMRNTSTKRQRGVPNIPRDSALPLGWCCHVPRWIAHQGKRNYRGVSQSCWTCSRCQWEGVWENGDRNQVFTPTGVRVPPIVLRELTGKLGAFRSLHLTLSHPVHAMLYTGNRPDGVRVLLSRRRVSSTQTHLRSQPARSPY